MQNAIASTMVEAKIDGIATLKMHSNAHAEVSIGCDDKNYGHSIDIYFYKRKVELNTCCFGSISANDQSKINYLIAAGALAANIKSLQEKFDAIDEDAYNKTYYAYSKAQWELERFDYEAMDAELKRKANEIEAKLVVGAKLRVGTDYYGKEKVDEIVRVTNKLIFLKDDYGSSTKKARAVENILGKHWEFVA